MKVVRIHFTDFSSDFVPEESFFFRVLSKCYTLKLDANSPDYLFYSCFGQEHLNYGCVRVFFTGENLRPDFNICDYAIGFDSLDFEGRYLRFPEFAMDSTHFEHLINRRTPEGASGRKFCNFIYSNAEADPMRDHFFELLNDYKPVDSLGPHLNNCVQPISERYASNWRESKVATQRGYKFSIAFENSLGNGYTTEKLMHAFVANTVPIYWGNPEVCKDFNPDAFINVHNYDSLNEVAEAVRHLDENESAYLAMLNAPAFVNDQVPQHLEEIQLVTFFEQVSELGQRRPKYGNAILYEQRLRRMERMRRRFGLIDRAFNKLFSKD